MYLALSLTANNITAKLTYNFTRTGLSTFDSQQLFTRLWWWLPLRLSKRQSPPTTKDLLRTTPTRTIAQHFHMLYSPPPPPRFKSFTVNRLLQFSAPYWKCNRAHVRTRLWLSRVKSLWALLVEIHTWAVKLFEF